VDVIPIKGNRWIARCADCGRAMPFDEQPQAWQWLLDHPCRSDDDGAGCRAG
jgi:hypothetical protein